MAKRQFKAESKRLLDLMINSIYTNKEIFLRELLSNASDAIDKIYYIALTADDIKFNREDYYIKITIDKNDRTLKVEDTGIGMSKEELSDNLGVIARSGSLDFKKSNEAKDGYDIIGQFGVGFYSAFMVSDQVTVISRPLGSDEAYKWESQGADGYTIKPHEKEGIGTEIVLKIKENSEDENFDLYLDERHLKSLVKKYSDFIRYPIKMDIPTERLKKGSEDEFETTYEEQVVNSMVPIWRKNKSELKQEDYENFYSEKHYGFDKPLKYVHVAADGAVNFRSILFVPEKIPYDFYTKEYEKGLALYANGVLIMEKCPDLLPDYFSFIKGMVDSEDLSLNISREMLQHNRQLKLIAKNIKNKIKNELLSFLKTDREGYEKFFTSFGRQLKFGIYNDFGMNKEDLQDLLMFYSSIEKKMVTLDEYVTRMKEEQKYIYFASGESNEKIDNLPQIELIKDKGYEILYFTEEIDEFAIRMLASYKEKDFKSVSDSDLGIEIENIEEKEESDDASAKGMLSAMKEILKAEVSDVRLSKRLKSHPVCLSSEGALSIEMEKVLRTMPVDNDVSASKVLEINGGHPVYRALETAYKDDEARFQLFTRLLYNQALLIEGLTVDDPLKFSGDICALMV
jgi:molecular chaperone HtpG